VIALSHDQGHIASKTLDFFGTVRARLGLPVVRTSVDHGTAYDLAGRFEADVRGQVNALRVGAELAPGALRGRRREMQPGGTAQPRPTNGIRFAITVMNSTFASSGRLAM
jgi:hypothetical protein